MSAATSCWAISDGAAGNARQALALARALGLGAESVEIVLREPWNTFAPRLGIGAKYGVRRRDGRPLQPPWPDLAIGCGRRAALVTRQLREWSGGHTYAVQVLDPRIASDAFDLVIAPQHDRVAGANVIASIGALNPVDSRWLADGLARFAELAMLPSPRTAVLIGGSNRAQALDAAYFEGLVERLVALHEADGGSFLASVSRRTPAPVAARLRARFATMPGRFWSGAEDGDNPYMGFLAHADRIVVTPDSVNMLSEACATGKPVYTWAARPIRGKLAAFHDELVASGHLRRLGDIDARPRPPPLAETAAIAELVRARWQAARKTSHGNA